MNKLITKFKQNKTDNARKWKHANGGILKCQKGSPWLSREEQAYNDRLMSKKGSFMVDSIYNKHIDPIKGAGVAGSMALESSFNPNARGGSHLGYVQNESRIVNYIKRNYGGYDHNAQVRFLLDGLTKGLPDSTSVMGRDLQTRFNNYNWKTYKTPEEAARAWEKSYEKSGGQGNNQRLYYSRMFYNLINNRLRGHKKGGSLSKKSKGAFVPGVDITDYNPKAYKYVKKKYGVKKALDGTQLNTMEDINKYFQYNPNKYFQDNGSTVINQSPISTAFTIYQNSANERAEEQQMKKWKETERKLLEMQTQQQKFDRLLSMFENLGNLTKKPSSSVSTTTTSTSTATPSYVVQVPKIGGDLSGGLGRNYLTI